MFLQPPLLQSATNAPLHTPAQPLSERDEAVGFQNRDPTVQPSAVSALSFPAIPGLVYQPPPCYNLLRMRHSELSRVRPVSLDWCFGVEKTGLGVDCEEAIIMHLVREWLLSLGIHDVPIPRILAIHPGTSTNADPGDSVMADSSSHPYGEEEGYDDETDHAKNDTFYMSYIDGEPLLDAWPQLKDDERISILSYLRQFVQLLRHFPAPTDIEIHVKDRLLIRRGPRQHVGPFRKFPACRTTAGFKRLLRRRARRHLIDEYDRAVALDCVADLPDGSNSSEDDFRDEAVIMDDGLVFTHGSFRPEHILVRGGRVVGLLDWSEASWCPEYWEYCKAHMWEDDWTLDGFSVHGIPVGEYIFGRGQQQEDQFALELVRQLRDRML